MDSLGSVTLYGVSIEDFTPSLVGHMTDVAADVATITVAATPAYAAATVAIIPDDGHQVNLETVANVITVTPQTARSPVSTR